MPHLFPRFPPLILATLLLLLALLSLANPASSFSLLPFANRAPPDSSLTQLSASKSQSTPVNSLSEFNLALSDNLVALVFFNAAWCGPCRLQVPAVDLICSDSPVPCFEVDVDDQPEVVEVFEVEDVPTILIFREGRVAERVVGTVNPSVLSKLVTKVLTQGKGC